MTIRLGSAALAPCSLTGIWKFRAGLRILSMRLTPLIPGNWNPVGWRLIARRLMARISSTGTWSDVEHAAMFNWERQVMAMELGPIDATNRRHIQVARDVINQKIVATFLYGHGLKKNFTLRRKRNQNDGAFRLVTCVHLFSWLSRASSAVSCCFMLFYAVLCCFMLLLSSFPICLHLCCVDEWNSLPASQVV